MELWRYNAALWLVKTPMSSPSIGWCISFSEWFNVFQPSTDPGGCLVWTHSFIKFNNDMKMWRWLKIDIITALTSFARNLGQRNAASLCISYIQQHLISDAMTSSQVTTLNLHRDIFPAYFPLLLSQWNSFVCFYFNLTGWQVTTVLTFPLRVTPHNLDTITDCSPGPRTILFILLHFWRHFPQAAEAKLAELNRRVTFGKEFNSCKFSRIQTGQVTLNESFVGLVIMMGRSHPTSSDRLISEILPR